MKRDFELIRKILIWVEQQPDGFPGQNPFFDGIDSELVSYHVHLLGQQGWLEVFNVTHMDSKSPAAIVRCLTNAGHDALDAFRDDSIWNQAKQAASGVSSVSLALLKDIAVSCIRKSIGL